MTVRHRARAIDTGKAEGVQPTPEILVKVKEVVGLNAAKNKATREENAAKKQLTRLIAAVRGLTRFIATVGARDYEVTYEKKASESVDGAKLYAEVGPDGLAKILEIGSFAQGAVKDAFGSNVLALCLVKGEPDHKLSIKEYKE